MVRKSDLKQIVMMTYLTDEMLDKLIPLTDQLHFDENEYVFRQGDAAERFYMVHKGKVLLEEHISDAVTVIVNAIKPGFSFGWSAMLDQGDYTTDAVCSEPTALFSFRAEKIKKLWETDANLGFAMTQRLLRIIKKRYDSRTEQFVKAIMHHPDLKQLL